MPIHDGKGCLISVCAKHPMTEIERQSHFCPEGSPQELLLSQRCNITSIRPIPSLHHWCIICWISPDIHMICKQCPDFQLCVECSCIQCLVSAFYSLMLVSWLNDLPKLLHSVVHIPWDTLPSVSALSLTSIARGPAHIVCSNVGRLIRVDVTGILYSLTMPGHQPPVRPCLINSARSYQYHPNFPIGYPWLRCLGLRRRCCLS